jgi:hypothetical protein
VLTVLDTDLRLIVEIMTRGFYCQRKKNQDEGSRIDKGLLQGWVGRHVSTPRSSER